MGGLHQPDAIKWRWPRGTGPRCPHCGCRMRHSIATNDCPRCGRSERTGGGSVHRHAADQVTGTERTAQAVHESVQQAELELEQRRAARSFGALEPSPELAAERNWLLGSVLASALCVYLTHPATHVLAAAQWRQAAVCYAFAALIVHGLGLNSGFLAARVLSFALAAATLVVAAQLLLGSVPAGLGLERLSLGSAGGGWVVWQGLQALWLLVFIPRELQAMHQHP
jgi:hypothetical protein